MVLQAVPPQWIFAKVGIAHRGAPPTSQLISPPEGTRSQEIQKRPIWTKADTRTDPVWVHLWGSTLRRHQERSRDPGQVSVSPTRSPSQPGRRHPVAAFRRFPLIPTTTTFGKPDFGWAPFAPLGSWELTRVVIGNPLFDMADDAGPQLPSNGIFGNLAWGKCLFRHCQSLSLGGLLQVEISSKSR